MLTRLVPTLLAATLALGAASGAATGAESPVANAATGAAETPDSYAPQSGVLFNDPTGGFNEQRRLFIHIRRTVSSVPPGGVIRFAVFSFADKYVSRALLAAHERGVRVKLVFSGSNVYPPMERLRDEIGTDVTARSFVRICEQSCRGTRGQMHAKYFSFSRTTGGSRYVTMVGSNNLTVHNATEQWSDLHTVSGDEEYYRSYLGWFNQLKLDQPVDPPYLSKVVGGRQVDIAPIRPKEDGDPIRTALSKVRCEVTEGELDPESETPDELVHTKLRIATSAWNEERGQKIAWAVAALLDQGCRVRVFYGPGTGPVVLDILENAGAVLSKGTVKGVRTHQKMLLVRGAYDGALDGFHVLTGSHNWSNRAYGRDDIVLQLPDDDVGRDYWRGFDYMWENG